MFYNGCEISCIIYNYTNVIGYFSHYSKLNYD